MSFDPQAYGARCTECILYGNKPVQASGPYDAGLVVIGEAPDRDSVEMGVPFVGPPGDMLNRALKRAGLDRTDVRVSSVLSCRPAYDGDLKRTLKDLAARNKIAKREQRQWLQLIARTEKKYDLETRKWRRAVGRLWARYEKLYKKWEAAAEKHRLKILRWSSDRSPPPPPLKPFLPIVPDGPEQVVLPPAPKSKILPTPMECCRPRLDKDIAHAKTLLIVGGTALEAMTGRTNIMEEQGAPMRLEDGRWAVATLHPAAILRGMEQYRKPFAHWVENAVRIHKQGGCNWKDPDPIYTDFRVATALGDLLKESDYRQKNSIAPLRVACDVETDGLNPTTASLRCVGLSWHETAVVVAIRSIAGDYIAYGPSLQRLKQVLVHPHIVKVFHNGSYDRTSLQANDLRVEGPAADTMLAYHALESEMPRSLAFLSSLMLRDAPSWKGLGGGDHGLSVQDDKQLWLYNGIDCYRTNKLEEQLDPIIDADGLRTVYEQSLQLQPIVADMQQRGLLLDLERREQVKEGLLKAKIRCEAELHEALDEAKRANPEWAAVFNEMLRITKKGDKSKLPIGCIAPFAYSRPVHMEAALQLLNVQTKKSDNGKRSKKADDLAVLIPMLDANARKFIGTKLSATSEGSGYLGAMSAQKASTTFCKGDPDPDGRIRVSWNITGTPTGRYSSTPSMQNVPEWLRQMYTAPPGYVYVAADYSALELWMVAYYTQAKNLLNALKSADVHRTNTEGLFGLKFLDTYIQAFRRASCLAHQPSLVTLADNGKDISIVDYGTTCEHCRAAIDKVFTEVAKKLKKLRVQAKRFVYNANYMGGEATIWQKLLVEFPDLQLQDVITLMHQWKSLNPEIFSTATANYNLYFKRRLQHSIGWLESPITGRKRYWTNKPFEISDAANYGVQAGAADVVNGATIRLYPQAKALGAYLVAQVHDSLVWEVPEKNAERMKNLLLEVLPGPFRIRGRSDDLYFPAEAKIGQRWSEV